jgi:hypothetical protein
MTYQRAVQVLGENGFNVSITVHANGDGTYTTTGMQVYCPSILSDSYIYRIDRLLCRGYKIQTLPNSDSLFIEKKKNRNQTII